MSIVELEDGMKGIAYKKTSQGFFSFLPLEIKEFAFKRVLLNYFSVDLLLEAIIEGVKKDDIKRFCILLPELIPSSFTNIGDDCL
jgi:hypothetical protein